MEALPSAAEEQLRTGWSTYWAIAQLPLTAEVAALSIPEVLADCRSAPEAARGRWTCTQSHCTREPATECEANGTRCYPPIDYCHNARPSIAL